MKTNTTKPKKKYLKWGVISSVILTITVVTCSSLNTATEKRVIPKIETNQFIKPNWSSQEAQNAKLVLNFVQKLMNEHDFEYIKNNQANTYYKQHNRTIEDGIEGVIKGITDFVNRYPNFSYDIKHLYVDGSFVIVHAHATTKLKDRGNTNKGLNLIDVWKVENNKIVEHWDAVQGLDATMRLFGFLTGGNVKNENSSF